ncbi:MAG: LysR family transcriptional regulator [Clostridia bacterium]|nr:LysR family transcriptional regulator [Clostridia bacterium]
MELKQLRSFIAVVESGSFTKAAGASYTSQPTISAHIKALEEELNVQLIARDTKNLRVTEKGRELYECALSMVQIQERLLKKWAGEQEKTIVIGASTIPSAYVLPPLLGAFQAQHPDIRLQIRQGDSAAIAEAVENGSCDLGVVGEDLSGRLQCTQLAEDRTVIISPNNDLYAKIMASGSVDKLLRSPVIFREIGSASRRSAENLLASLGKRPEELNIIAVLNDQEAIKNLVASGMGISFVSALAAAREAEDGRLLTFDTGLPEAQRRFFLAQRKNAKLPEPAEEFRRFLLAR